jgi:D-3-phosphoglycerate dehydrogenase
MLRVEPKVVVIARLTPESITALDTYCSVVKYGRAAGQEDFLFEEHMIEIVRKENPEVLIVEAEPVTADVLDSSSTLRLITCTRGNPVNVDIERCSEKGILVTNTPARNANAVAEFTIGLLICCARCIPQSFMAHKTRSVTVPGGEFIEKNTKDTTWIHPSLKKLPYNLFRGVEIETRILGLVGFGTIGQLVARKASALDLNMLVYDPYIAEQVVKEYHCKRVELDDLLQNADFVSLHAKVSGAMKPLIGEHELSLMKKTAYLINTARGALIDHDALRKALQNKTIAGAAIDVFAYEPLASDDLLLDLDNLIVTPHIAGASVDVVRHHSQMVLQDVIAYLDHKQPPHLVNPSAWKRFGG